jgi:hypothetical protein
MQTPYGEIPDQFVPDMSPQEMHDYLKRRYGRRSLLKGAAVVGAAAMAGPLFWKQSGAKASTVSAPQWIGYGADPSSQMYVSWAAGTYNGPVPATPSPQIRWGTSSSYGSTQAATGNVVPTPAGYTLNAADTDNVVYLQTMLSGLTPNTTYHYSVSNDGITWSDDTTFTTARTGVTDFRWVGTGDQSTSNSSSLPIAQAQAGYHPDFVVVAGDLSYASGGVVLPPPGGSQPAYSPGAWDTYLGIMGPTIAQSTPWLVGVGNHEMEPLDQHGYAGFLTRFPGAYDTSSGSPVVRTFTYSNVAFIGLDGNDLSAEISNNNGYTAGQQTAWLQSKLAAYRAPGSGIDFIVVYFHNCMFCTNQSHGSDGGIRTVWEPIFDQYKVDLVLNGHVHAYERTYPILNGQPTAVVPVGGTVYPDTQGTTYICAGGGGQSLYTSWYGTTGAGDAGSSTAPKVWEWSGGGTASGGSGSAADITDPSVGYSAVRKANWTFIVVDVKVPANAGGTTTMTIQAVDPTQSGSGISTIANPAIIDTVTISRQSVVTPPPELADVTTPGLLIASGVGVVGATAYLASKRDRLAAG